MKLFRAAVIMILLFPSLPLFTAEFTPAWQIGDLIFQKKQVAPFEEEPVANFTARYFADVLFLPSSVVIAPFYYGANIAHLGDSSYENALTIGFWTSYTLVGFPFAVLEYSFVRLPVKIFDRLF